MVEGRSTRSGASLKSPEVKGYPKGDVRGGKKRGRKRKAEDGAAFKISDFVDNQVSLGVLPQLSS